MSALSFVRLSRSLHTWGGFVLSLMIMLISLTGTLLVWKKEFLWLSIPEAREEIGLTPQAASQIVASAEQLFESNDILLVQFESENLSIHKLFLSGGRYAYLDGRGELLDYWRLNERPEEWLYDLHHRLLLGDTGLLVSGFAALLMLCLIPPALIAWWPTRKSFRWRILIAGLLRPQLLATHRNLGVLVALPAIFLFVTAVILSFPNEVQDILVEPHTGTEGYSKLYEQGLDELTGPEYGTWTASFTRAIEGMDGARIRSAQLPKSYSDYNLIGVQQQGDWHPSGLSKVYIDKGSGRMDMRLNSFQLPLSIKAYNLNYPLHTGKVNSLVYRICLTFTGLSIFALSLLGFVSFIKKLRISR